MKKYFLLLIFILFINFTYSSNNPNIDNFQNNYNNMVENIFQSMVSIKAIKTDYILENQENNDLFLYKENNHIFSTGSGFFIDEMGTIITNYHVIKNSNKIIVTTENKEEFYCDVIGYDRLTDIAVLKVKSNKRFRFIKLNNNTIYNIGDNVFVIGNPYNLGMSMSKGIISGINRTLQNGENKFYNNLIQTDATINKGNSGGALFKNNGDLIGMISTIFSPNGTNIGLGFAIPIQDIINIIEQINTFGYISRGWIGIKSGEEIHGEELKILGLKKNNGVIITNIQKNSPADLADLQISDIVIYYNDNLINSFDQLITLIRSTSVNSYANMVVYRNNELKKITVKVSEYIDEDNYFEDKKYFNNNFLKILNSDVLYIDNTTRKRFNLHPEDNGLYIIKPSEYFKNNNIQTGDIIVSINQININNKTNINKLITNLRNNNSFIIIVKQNRKNKLFVLHK